MRSGRGVPLRSEAEILESEIERHFNRQVKARGGWTLKFSVPGVRGLPDRLCFMPNGILLLCELKRPKGGKFHALQTYVHIKLEALGFPVHRAHTRGRVDLIFEEYDKRVQA